MLHRWTMGLLAALLLHGVAWLWASRQPYAATNVRVPTRQVATVVLRPLAVGQPPKLLQPLEVTVPTAARAPVPSPQPPTVRQPSVRSRARMESTEPLASASAPKAMRASGQDLAATEASGQVPVTAGTAAGAGDAIEGTVNGSGRASSAQEGVHDGPYAVQQVDEPPRPLHVPPPVYPESAERRGESATVHLVVVLSPEGRVVEVTAQCAGCDPGFAAHARAAALLWRFAPARLRGEPVAVRFAQDIQFTLPDR